MLISHLQKGPHYDEAAETLEMARVDAKRKPKSDKPYPKPRPIVPSHKRKLEPDQMEPKAKRNRKPSRRLMESRGKGDTKGEDT